jgi:hypothetical protein
MGDYANIVNQSGHIILIVYPRMQVIHRLGNKILIDDLSASWCLASMHPHRLYLPLLLHATAGL